MPQRPIVAPKGLLNSSYNDMFGALRVRPSNLTFATQDPDEIVYILARRDVITNIGWVLRIAIGAVIPLVLLILTVNFLPSLLIGLPRSLLTIFPVLYYSFLISYGIVKFNDWYFNLFIVTNKRILDYDFKPLSTFQVAEADLENIQDVSQSSIGVFPAFFDYGDLLVQTAGQKNKFFFKSVPSPTWLRNVLVDLARLSRNPEP